MRRSNIFLLLFSLTVSMFILEFVARMLVPAPLPWLHPQIRYQPDQDLTYRLIPNQHAFTADKSVEINERGLRGRQYSYEKHENTMRILFIGDSVLFGYGVDMQNVFTIQIEKFFRKQGEAVEAINIGVPSYNTKQEITLLEKEGVKYNPDWVVLCYFWNDVSEILQVNKDGWLIQPGSESDEENSSGFTRFWISETGSSLRNIIKRSRFIYGCMQGVKELTSKSSESTGSALRTDLLAGNETAFLVDRWQEIDEEVQHFRKIADRYDFKPVIIVFPISLELEKPYSESGYVKTISGIAGKSDIPILDLTPDFRAAYKGHESLFIPFDGDHPNANGHEVAANAIQRYFIKNRRVE